MIKRSIATAVAFATLSATVANAAEDFEIGVSGFIHSAISSSSVDNKIDGDDKDQFAIHNDNLLNFSGATVLDNGLKATAVASFSFNQGRDTYAQENQNNIFKEELYVGLGGAFGQVDLGRRMNAASLLHTFIPSAGVGVFGVDGARISSFVGGNTNTTTAVSMGDFSTATLYANRIQYFTPRVEGLQLAASFTPDTDPNLSNVNVSTPSYYDRATDGTPSYKNEYSVAGNYAREFGDFGVKASAGYTNGQNSKASYGVLTATQDANGDLYPAYQANSSVRDFKALQGGLALSAYGFTLGGAYGEVESGMFTGGKERRYGGGAKYETGPWSFGVSYLQRKASGDTYINLANQQIVRKADFWEAGTSYALGSGVKTGAGVYYNDNSNNSNTAYGTTAAEDSITGLVNLSVNF